MTSARRLLATDIGGTFTDILRREKDGSLSVEKVLTDPDHPEDAIGDVISSFHPDIHHHGTTAATNAILERTGATVALLVTEGFRDLLTIGRQDRKDLYDFEPDPVEPLVSDDHIIEVTERVSDRGEVLTPLTEEEVDRVVRQVEEKKPDAVAICLIHSYLHPEHENQLERALPGSFPVSRSSDILPEYREYERASTTVLNAYVEPVIRDTLSAFDRGSEDLFLMKSTGGLGHAQSVKHRPVELILSGPAGGVVASRQFAHSRGIDYLVNLDMGGTSADVSLVSEGDPVRSPRQQIDHHPVGLPLLNISTIGAGGGSIVDVDAGGALRVGPESAGARPGPVCYGRGGENLTVTDAHLLLGHIGSDTPLGETLSLDTERTVSAYKSFCSWHHLDRAEAAGRILDVIDARMAREIRNRIVQWGHRPETFSLLAAGGAGPLHACRLAGRLGLSRVYIPNHPGAFSARGIGAADAISERSRTVLKPLPETGNIRQDYFEMLIEQVKEELGAVKNAEYHFQSLLDLRYQGQSYELTLPDGPDVDDRFHAHHRDRYGFDLPNKTIELVGVRVRGRVSSPGQMGWNGGEGPDSSEDVSVDDQRETDPVRKRGPLFEDLDGPRFPVYRREDLSSGLQMRGPLIIEDATATTHVPKGWTLQISGEGGFLLEK